MQDKVLPYSREEDNIWYTWIHFYSNLEVHGGNIEIYYHKAMPFELRI